MIQIKLLAAILSAVLVLGGTSVPILLPNQQATKSSTSGAVSPSLTVLSQFSSQAGEMLLRSASLAKTPFSGFGLMGKPIESNASHAGTGLSNPVTQSMKGSGAVVLQNANGSRSKSIADSHSKSTTDKNSDLSSSHASPPVNSASATLDNSAQALPTQDDAAPDVSNSGNSISGGDGGGGGGGGGGGSFSGTKPVDTNVVSQPVISVPPYVSAFATNASGAVVTYSVSATDQKDGALIPICSPKSGTIFSIGTTTVSCTATNSDSQIATAKFSVVVQDSISMIILPPDNVSIVANSVLSTILLGQPIVIDPFDSSPQVTNNAPPQGFPIGNTTVTWTATDSFGNSATATQLVTLTAQRPTLSVPSGLVVEATNASGAVVTYSVSATDQKDGALIPICSPKSGTVFAIGSATVACSALNSLGGIAHESFNVTVRDTTPPRISGIAPLTGTSTGRATPLTLVAPIVTDLVDKSPKISNNAPPQGFPIGNTTVTWTATDSFGNSATATQLVTIFSNTSGTLPQTPSLSESGPSFSLGQVTYISSSTTLSLSVSNSSDISGLYYRYFVSGQVQSIPPFSTGHSFSVAGQDGSYLVQYYSQDIHGLSGPVQNATLILDNSPARSQPSIANLTELLPSDRFAISSLDNSGSGIGGSALSGIYYSIDGNLAFSFSKSSNATVSTNLLTGGVHSISYYAVDNLGNREVTRTMNFSVYDCQTMPLDQIRGVNYGDPVLMDVQGGYSILGAVPPSNDVRMKDLTSNGFNTLRVPYLWTAYEKHPAATLQAMSNIAAAAQTYKMCVIFDNQQSKTAVKFGGAGFPDSITAQYTNYTDLWRDYYNNTITVNGTKVWDMQANMMDAIISSVDSYPSVFGYEIINEPKIFGTDQYAKLGDLQTYIANSIREKSNRYIIFDQTEPEFSGKIYVDYTYEPAIKPRISSKLIWGPHAYEDVGEPMKFLFERYNNLNNASWNLPMLIGEWGQTTQNGTMVYVNYFKTQNLGWIRWAYDQFDPTYNLMDANYNPTVRYTWLLDAMKQ